MRQWHTHRGSPLKLSEHTAKHDFIQSASKQPHSLIHFLVVSAWVYPQGREWLCVCGQKVLVLAASNPHFSRSPSGTSQSLSLSCLPTPVHQSMWDLCIPSPSLSLGLTCSQCECVGLWLGVRLNICSSKEDYCPVAWSNLNTVLAEEWRHRANPTLPQTQRLISQNSTTCWF